MAADTRDAALETVLALLVEQLHPWSGRDERLGSVLDYWALQAPVGFRWVKEVTRAFIDLLEENLPSAADRWFVGC